MGDNGFVRGVAGVVPLDETQPAQVWALGGDCVGDEGRTWTEAAEYNPETGWQPVSARVRPDWAVRGGPALIKI